MEAARFMATAPSAVEWGVLIATVATAGFTGWAIWQRWRYTPRPLWIAPSEPTTATFEQEGGAVAIEVSWRVENRGDAAAHDVHVFLRSGSGWSELAQKSAGIVGPGEYVAAWVSLDGIRPGPYLPLEDRHESNPSIKWTPHQLRLEWRQHPNLRRVKHAVWDLPEPQEQSDV